MKWMAWFVVVLVSGGSPAVVQADEVLSVASEMKPVEPAKHKLARRPRSAAAGLGEAAVDFRLPTVDRVALAAEDAAADGPDKPLRIGVFRDLPAAPAPAKAKGGTGNWAVLPDGGQVWRLVVESAEAIGIRVHLGGVNTLPADSEITAYAANEPTQMRGPYSGENLSGRDDFWTGTVFSEKVTVECYLPPGADRAQAALTADRIAHIYRDPVAKAKVGDCHNDVACYPSWVSVGNGVAGIGTIGESGVLWCTGCLLNDQAPATFIDYFMTANHCVAKQSEADDTEFYWFYQTSTCGGSPPSLSSVTTTDGGATYLAGRTADAANDFSFLQLRRAAPGGTTYAGWSVATPSSSETLVGIHHPDGSYKRLSIANLDSSDANYWYVQWSSGVTEPGSSGSPLFNASKQFIGQLYGGESACNFQNGIDEYGRFSVSYPYIKQWLGSSALALSPVSRTHSPVAATAQRVAVSATKPWTATDNRSWITITSGSSGSGSGTLIYRLSANTGQASRSGTITFTGGGVTRTFAISQAAGDAYEPDDAYSAAKMIANGQTQARSIHAAGNKDWVKFTIGSSGARNVRLETAGTSGDTELRLYNSRLRRVAYDDDSGVGRFSKISLASLPRGTYYASIREYGNNGRIAAYTLRLRWTTP